MPLKERTQAGETPLHIGFGDFLFQVTVGSFHHEIDFVVRDFRIKRRLPLFQIRRPDFEIVLPRNHKEKTTVFGLRNHHRGIRRHELFVDHNVRPAGNPYEAIDFSVCHPTNVVHPGTGTIKETPCFYREGLSGFFVFYRHGGHTVAFNGHPRHRHVVEGRRPFTKRRLHQGNRRTRVIKLRVVELHGAFQSFALKSRQSAERSVAGKDRHVADAETAGSKCGIKRHTGRIKGEFPPGVTRHHKSLRMHQLRRIL